MIPTRGHDFFIAKSLSRGQILRASRKAASLNRRPKFSTALSSVRRSRADRIPSLAVNPDRIHRSRGQYGRSGSRGRARWVGWPMHILGRTNPVITRSGRVRISANSVRQRSRANWIAGVQVRCLQPTCLWVRISPHRTSRFPASRCRRINRQLMIPVHPRAGLRRPQEAVKHPVRVLVESGDLPKQVGGCWNGALLSGVS